MFGNLLDEATNFDLFWNLLSRNAVCEGTIAENFAEINAKPSEFALAPATTLPAFQWTHRHDQYSEASLRDFYYLFMDEMVDPSRREMLNHCFVNSSRLDQYEGDLKRMLRDAAPSFVTDAEEVTPGDHRAALNSKLGNVSGRVVVVTGSVGCGKSTFVTRVLTDIRTNKSAHCVVLDLIDDTGLVPDVSVTDLWSRVYAAFRRDHSELFKYEVLRKAFGRELKMLRQGPRAKLFEIDSEAYDRDEAELLESLSSDPQKYLVAAWRYLAAQGRTVLAFLDNVDRASELFQQQTYSFAHRLARETGANVIVPMREMTFFRGKSAGFLDIRTSDLVLHLKAPNPRQVLARRIRYVENHLAGDHRLRKIKAERDDAVDVFQAIAADLKRQLLAPGEGKEIVHLVSAVSWHDIREFLRILRHAHVALTDVPQWTYSLVVGVLSASASESNPRWLPSLYASPFPAFACVFLKTRILALLLYGESGDRLLVGRPFSAVFSAMRLYGYQDRWTRAATEMLVRERLLECLEAPSAADHTKGYVLDEKHTFRPSPLALVLVERVQREPAYLSLTAREMGFHSRKHFQRYVSHIEALVDALGEEKFSTSALDLLGSGDGLDAVRDQLSEAYSQERPLGKMARFSPQVYASEMKLNGILTHLLTPFSGQLADKLVDTPAMRLVGQQLELASVVEHKSPKNPLIPPPQNVKEVSEGNAKLIGVVLWVLVELRARGQQKATGAQITAMMNAWVFADEEAKEKTNVSRALRGRVMRRQSWLAVEGKPRRYRYELAPSWKDAWKHYFLEDAPTV